MNRRLFLLAPLALAGCRPKRKRSQQGASLGTPQYERILALVIDLSGSFYGKMIDGGEAYQFLSRVIDRYFRASIGTEDTILIGQISGADQPLLYDGTAARLRQKFASASDFNEFLRSKAANRGSNVHDSIRRAIEYVTADRRVATGEAKAALLVLSDMEDSTNDANAEQRLVQSLANFRRRDGVVGLYYVNQNLVERWRKALPGGPDAVVHSDIQGEPPLPNF